jgi:hypothetical protein
MLAILNQYVVQGRKIGRPSIARLKVDSKKRKRPEGFHSAKEIAQLGSINATMKRLKL